MFMTLGYPVEGHMHVYDPRASLESLMRVYDPRVPCRGTLHRKMVLQLSNKDGYPTIQTKVRFFS